MLHKKGNLLMYNQKCFELGSNRSCIRELFEYGCRRAAEVGRENVYDYSLGNPSVPAPAGVNEAIRDILADTDSVAVHGYTSAVGDMAARQAIADDLGMKLEIQDLPFQSVIAAVQNGNADIALSGITVTEDRKEQVNFSITYTTATQAIIVKEGSSLTSAADLEGKKVGTQLSTTGDI